MVTHSSISTMTEGGGGADGVMRREKVVDVRKTKSILLCLVIRRGTIHAAREGRNLHGGHCLVRTHKVMIE